MAIDYDVILNSFVVRAQEVLANDLSSSGPPGSPEPSVIIARQPGPTPNYPYVQLDLISTVQTDGYETGRGVDELTEQVYYETHYKLLLQYTVFGGNANSIAHKLESYFRFESVLNKIEEDTTGTLEETFAVRSIPEKRETDWLEVAQFQLTFNINDQSENTDGDGIIQTINIDGEVKRNSDDSDPLTFSISESSL